MIEIKSPLPAFTKEGNVRTSLIKGGGAQHRRVLKETTPPSLFTRRKSVIRIIRDVGKAWFPDTLRAGFAIAHTAPSRKSGFTLAEVLITLGIIGVVAAMTLPTVLNNIQNKQLETALKKSYSLLSQVTQRVVMEDFGGMVDAENGKEISSYFVKHYKNGNICGSGKTSGCPVTTGGDEACNFMKQNYKNFNGKTNGGCVGNDIISNTIDSTTLYFDAPREGEGAETEENILMAVDVNGWQKKPNRWGHDIFMFQLTKGGKLLPMGAKDSVYPEETYCSLTSTSVKNGRGCTVKALNDTDYFKKLPK